MSTERLMRGDLPASLMKVTLFGWMIVNAALYATVAMPEAVLTRLSRLFPFIVTLRDLMLTWFTSTTLF